MKLGKMFRSQVTHSYKIEKGCVIMNDDIAYREPGMIFRFHTLIRNFATFCAQTF